MPLPERMRERSAEAARGLRRAGYFANTWGYVPSVPDGSPMAPDGSRL